MYDKIPLPTDSLYKFCALFSILLITFVSAMTIYVSRSTNELIFKTVVEIQVLKAVTNSTDIEAIKIAALTKEMDIAVKDKGFYLIALGILGGLATMLGIFGFHKWRTETQPVADELARVQLELAKIELKKAQTENSNEKDKP